jgi:hypothetical protein
MVVFKGNKFLNASPVKPAADRRAIPARTAVAARSRLPWDVSCAAEVNMALPVLSTAPLGDKTADPEIETAA